MENQQKKRLELNVLLKKYPIIKQVLLRIEQVVWVQELKSDQILYVNPAFEPVWGYACEELYTNPKILFDSIHPEDRVKVLAGMSYHDSETTKLNYRIRRSDGKTLWISSQSFLTSDEDGKPDFLLTISQDITNHKLVEGSLRISMENAREQFRLSHKLSLARNPDAALKTLMSAQELRSAQRAALILFHNPKAGPVHGLDLTTTWQSSQTLPFWESEGELYDESDFINLFHPHQTVMISDIYSDPRITSQICDHLKEGHHDALTIFPLYTSGDWLGVLIMYFEKGKILNHIYLRHLKVLFNQLTITLQSLKLLEVEEKSRHMAELANEIKTEFLAMVSHELRTPLTSIIGFTTTLLAEDVNWNQEDQHDFILTIQQEADRLQELIDHLLDLSRLEAGMLPIRPKPQSLQEIIQDASSQLQMLTHSHYLTMQVSESLPLLNVDAKRIAQVLVNLVKNATTFAAEGTEIEISAKVQGDFIQISVSDQGPGIPLKNRKHVFTAFLRGQDSENTFPKGAGLGLAICKGLVDAHGGRIWIRNKKTPGTTIAFTIPLVPENILETELVKEN